MLRDRPLYPEPDELRLPDYAAIHARLYGVPRHPEAISPTSRAEMAARERRKAEAEEEKRALARLVADADRAKSEEMKRKFPRRIYAVIAEISGGLGSNPHRALTGRSLQQVAVRHAIYYEIMTTVSGVTTGDVARMFGSNPSTIMHALRRYALKHDLPRPWSETYTRLKRVFPGDEAERRRLLAERLDQ